VVKRSRGVAGQLSGGIGHLLKKNKVTVVMGEATLPARARSGDHRQGHRNPDRPDIILATGARARELPGLEADGDRVWTYRHALVPKRMPKDLLVIGSGAIGIEFASFFNTLGAKTTVVEVMDRVSARGRCRDQRALRRSIRQAGHDDPGERPRSKSWSAMRTGVTAHLETAARPRPCEVDTVISAVGIVGNVEGLGLEALGREDRPHPCRDG
jgi:dihydrolipoamide dehydrogenase